MDDRPHKAHRPAQSRAKAEKKIKGKVEGKERKSSMGSTKRCLHLTFFFPLSRIHHVSQAFAPKSGRRADRQGRRNVEQDQTRLHVPLVNRTPDDDPPPVIIAIVGSPGVGKTALLKSLVRRYTKQMLNDVKGPVTVVSGRNAVSPSLNATTSTV